MEKIANFILSLFYDCPGTITPSTPPTYTLPGGTQIYINITSTTGQGTGGNITGSSPAALNTGNNCECKDNCEKVCGNPDEYCISGKCTKVTIDTVEAKVNGKKGIFVEVQDWLSFEGTATGQNCEYQYKWDLGDGRTEEAQNLPFKYYVAAGVYYPSFTTSCKKCGPSKSDQVMVVVGCPDTYADPTMCCVPHGKLVPNNPIEDLSQCTNRVRNTNWDLLYQDKGGYDYDGCTNIFDNPAAGYFTAFTNEQRTGACDFHDRCYQTCWAGTASERETARLACDKKFRDVAAINCLDELKVSPVNTAACLIYAQAYSMVLMSVGDSFFEDRQKQVCNCCK